MTITERDGGGPINLRERVEDLVSRAIAHHLASRRTAVVIPGGAVMFGVEPIPFLGAPLTDSSARGRSAPAVVSPQSARARVSILVKVPDVDEYVTEAFLVKPDAENAEVYDAVSRVLTAMHDEIGRRRAKSFAESLR